MSKAKRISRRAGLLAPGLFAASSVLLTKPFAMNRAQENQDFFVSSACRQWNARLLLYTLPSAVYSSTHKTGILPGREK